MKQNYAIDFVVPWVDGNDPAWQAERRKYQPIKENESDGGACRYRDWDVMKYWFRAIEENAPWVRKIHFITCGQVPDFLNLDNPKLNFVRHEDYIPTGDLPTFSANPIEINLHRIKDLSEHFVYLNDDVFLNAPTSPDQWFRNRKPCSYLRHRHPLDEEISTASQNYPGNCMEVINRHFSRKDMLKAGLHRIASPKFGKTALRNLYMLRYPNFQMFSCPHIAAPLLKSTLAEVWQKEPERMATTSGHRFRDASDINQYVFRYWDLANGNFEPLKPNFKDYSINTHCLSECVDDVLNGKHAQICINDNELCDDFEKCKTEIQMAFEKRYPNKCSFEK